eukprot:SAG31_NODE_16350_length_712_cov_1.657423_1_plen_149_part_00
MAPGRTGIACVQHGLRAVLNSIRVVLSSSRRPWPKRSYSHYCRWLPSAQRLLLPYSCMDMAQIPRVVRPAAAGEQCLGSRGAAPGVAAQRSMAIHSLTDILIGDPYTVASGPVLDIDTRPSSAPRPAQPLHPASSSLVLVAPPPPSLY